MPRRPALLTQADVRRVVKGAWQAGAAEVVVQPDGKILVRRKPSTEESDPALEEKGEIVL